MMLTQTIASLQRLCDRIFCFSVSDEKIQKIHALFVNFKTPTDEFSSALSALSRGKPLFVLPLLLIYSFLGELSRVSVDQISRNFATRCQ